MTWVVPFIGPRKGSHANRELRTPRSTGRVNALKHFAKWLAQNVWENTEQKSDFFRDFHRRSNAIRMPVHGRMFQ